MNLIDNDQIGKDALVALTNARFADVVNGCFFDPETRMIIKGNKIVAMPGIAGEEDNLEPDLAFDLRGKTVLPGLFNVHCHIHGY